MCQAICHGDMSKQLAHLVPVLRKFLVKLPLIMVETEINNYINKKCYDCCHFKKENMELYKLNLPNGIVNNIIDYALDEEKCKNCKSSRFYQELIKCQLNYKRFLNTNVEDDIIIFLTVYERPPYDYVTAFMKISKKKMK